jgi:hypothetical protein
MKGKSLTYEERFYIEKRLSEGVRQARIASELQSFYSPNEIFWHTYRPHNDPWFCCISFGNWHGSDLSCGVVIHLFFKCFILNK